MAIKDYDNNRQEFTDYDPEYIGDYSRHNGSDAAQILPDPEGTEKSSGWKTAAIAASAAVIIGGVGTAVYAMSNPADELEPQPTSETESDAESGSIADNEIAKTSATETTTKTTTTHVTNVHNYNHNDYFVHHPGDVHPVWIDATVPVAYSPNDAMSFSHAFAAARAEVGPGGCFAWRGGIYGTYYYDEWHNMSSAEKALYASHFNWNYIDHSYSDLQAYHEALMAEPAHDELLSEHLMALRDVEVPEEPATISGEGDGEDAPVIGVEPEPTDGGEEVPVVGIDDPALGLEPNPGEPIEMPIDPIDYTNVDSEFGPDYNNDVEVLGYEDDAYENSVEFDDPNSVVVDIEGDIAYAGVDNHSVSEMDHADAGVDYYDSSMDMASDYTADQIDMTDSFDTMDYSSDVC